VKCAICGSTEHPTDKCDKLGKKMEWKTIMLLSKWVFDPGISHVRLVNLWHGFAIPLLNVLKLVEAIVTFANKKG
jgi:hypothetical protein